MRRGENSVKIAAPSLFLSVFRAAENACRPIDTRPLFCYNEEKPRIRRNS